MKKALILIFTVTIFMVSGFLGLKSFNMTANARAAELKHIDQKLLTNISGNERLLLLIKSDALEPTESKKLRIAEEYLKLGNAPKAERYLQKVDNQEAFTKVAETALETNNTNAIDLYLSRISGKEKLELEIFEAFSKGKIERLNELDLEPKTELGKLMRTINGGDYKNNAIKSYLGEKIENLKGKDLGKVTLRLEIAKMLINNDQTNIARFILEQLKEEGQNTTDLTRLLVLSYKSDSNHELALKEAKKLIELEPSNQANYLEALVLAQKTNNKTDIEYLQSQLTYLQKIQK